MYIEKFHLSYDVLAPPPSPHLVVNLQEKQEQRAICPGVPIKQRDSRFMFNRNEIYVKNNLVSFCCCCFFFCFFFFFCLARFYHYPASIASHIQVSGKFLRTLSSPSENADGPEDAAAENITDVSKLAR